MKLLALLLAVFVVFLSINSTSAFDLSDFNVYYNTTINPLSSVYYNLSWFDKSSYNFGFYIFMYSNASRNAIYIRANNTPILENSTYDFNVTRYYLSDSDYDFEYRFYIPPNILQDGSYEIIMFVNNLNAPAYCYFIFNLIQVNDVVFEDRVYAADDEIEPQSFKFYNINYADFGSNVQHGLVAQFIFYGNDSANYLNCFFKKNNGTSATINLDDFSESTYPITSDTMYLVDSSQDVYEQFYLTPDKFTNGSYLMAIASTYYDLRDIYVFIELFSLRNLTLNVTSDNIVAHSNAWKFFNFSWTGDTDKVLSFSAMSNDTGLQIYLKFGSLSFTTSEYQYQSYQNTNTTGLYTNALTLSTGVLSSGNYTIAIFNNGNNFIFNLTAFATQAPASNPITQGLIIAIIVGGVIALLLAGAFVYIIFLRKEKNYYKSISLEDSNKGLLSDEKK